MSVSTDGSKVTSGVCVVVWEAGWRVMVTSVESVSEAVSCWMVSGVGGGVSSAVLPTLRVLSVTSQSLCP